MGRNVLLAEYSKEIGLSKPISIDMLIESHRRLRALSMRSNEERLAELQKAREFGRAQGFAEVTDGEYIAVKTLRSMTVRELAQRLGTEDVSGETPGDEKK